MYGLINRSTGWCLGVKRWSSNRTHGSTQDELNPSWWWCFGVMVCKVVQGKGQRFLWVSMQRTMYSLEQLRVCWPSSSPEVRLDDWPVTERSSARHVSQCLSTILRPRLVEPCQMLFFGLTDGGKQQVTKTTNKKAAKQTSHTRMDPIRHPAHQRSRWVFGD